MDSLNAKTVAIGNFALALVNLLAVFGAHLPAWAGATVVASVNAAALVIVGTVATIKHALEAKR